LRGEARERARGADARDAVAGDRDVAEEPGGAGPVDDVAALEHDVEGAVDARGLRAEGLRARGVRDADGDEGEREMDEWVTTHATTRGMVAAPRRGSGGGQGYASSAARGKGGRLAGLAIDSPDPQANSAHDRVNLLL